MQICSILKKELYTTIKHFVIKSKYEAVIKFHKAFIYGCINSIINIQINAKMINAKISFYLWNIM